MDIKFKGRKTAIFITSLLMAACSLLLSCKSANLENEVFNKIVHSREYVFDITDIDEYPKLKREKGTKKLIYSIDFTEYVKYDLPKAGDRLTLKYKGYPNKDVPGVINVTVAGLPADMTESYVFASNLEKRDVFENQVSFTLKQDLEEVVFNLKYDNPKTYFSVSLAMEKVTDTTDTKAEKQALEKAIKRGQTIVEVSNVNGAEIVYKTEEEVPPVIEEAAPPVVETAEEEQEEQAAPPVVAEQEQPEQENEQQEQPPVKENYGDGRALVTPDYYRPRKRTILDIKDTVYHKLAHPRLYYFDINKIDNFPKLKKVKESNKLVYSVDFTKLAKEDMPQAGDKIVFISQGFPNKDVPGTIYASLETPSAEKVVFAKDLKKKESYRARVSFVLKENLDEIKLNLEYDNPNEYSSVFMTMEQAIFSTDTAEENREYKKAVRQGREIVEWTNEIIDDNKKSVPETPSEEITVEQKEEPEQEPELPAEVPVEQVIVPEQPPIVVPVPEEIPEKQEEEIVEELPEEQETEEKPAEQKMVPELEKQPEVVQEPEIKEEPAPVKEKTPEELLMEERKKLAEQQKKLAEEQAKLEAEKARFAAEEKAKREAEAARLAQEAKDRALQAEQDKLEAERLKQKQMLDETIEAVTNTNVKRYEKEYLNDYAVSGYTFDMEQKQQQETQIFRNPDKADKLGRTLLMEAAKEGNDWKIKALITSGADVNLKDNDGWTALMYAVRYNGNMNCVDLLIDAGADVKAVNNYGMSALVMAANFNSNPEILKKLLGYYSPNEKDVLTSFIQVLTENQEDEYMQIIKVNLFLDMSVPLNSLYNGKTPLMYAAESGNSTKVLKLLMENSSTSVRSREGKTAFDYAKENPKLKHDDIYWSLNNK